MLKPYSTIKVAGYTMIELMVIVAVIAILSVVAVPGVQAWVQSSQIRTAATAVTNGLQKARSEAIARNRNVEFVVDGINTSWNVMLPDGTVIETRSSDEGTETVTGLTTPLAATTVTFDSFGNVVANADATVSLVRVTVSINGSNVKHLAADVNNGRIKMCDPSLAVGSSPRAC